MDGSTHLVADQARSDGGKRPLKVAVVGTGIAGMAAAWLLNQRHQVTVYEKDGRPGGHSNTVLVNTAAADIPVDTGFIVYNELNYPNLTALFAHLGVPTKPSDMSFAVTLDDGALEYGGSGLATLFAQRRNLLRPRFWTMLRDIRRFYREAPAILEAPDTDSLTLGDYLEQADYSRAFIDDHLLPMAAAVWSAPPTTMLAHPAAAFVRFCRNHGLLQLRGRPQWRTVAGGSQAYVRRLTAPYAAQIRFNAPVQQIRRADDGVYITSAAGGPEKFDHVVIAAHADQTLALLADPSPAERRLLAAIRYERNEVVLHDDARLMPRRRRAWASWNYLGTRERRGGQVCVTYWMNRLQDLPGEQPLFVTVNPPPTMRPRRLRQRFVYDHPVYTPAALQAQRSLREIQGVRRTWYCGAYCGAGFHEDGLQAGLWVAEALGGVRRPWTVADESGRIFLGAVPGAASEWAVVP